MDPFQIVQTAGRLHKCCTGRNKRRNVAGCSLSARRGILTSDSDTDSSDGTAPQVVRLLLT